MDSEFLALSLVFVLIGATGIVLFYGPLTPAGDSCYCLIPSPEPRAAQGTSSIFLMLGLIFLPMGLMKGGLPTFRRGPGPAIQPRGVGVPVAPSIPITSASMVWIGILLVVVGGDALLIPGYLVLKSLLFEAGGGGLAAVGVLSIALGLRKPKGP